MTAWSKWYNNEFILELLRYLPAHIFWKDINGVYLGCNNKFSDSLGLSSPQEIIGKTDYDLPVQKKDSDLYREDDQKVMLSCQPKLDIEEEQTLLNGDKIYLLTSKVPLFNKKNDVTGILGIYSDITELKKTQQRLQQEKLRAEAASDAKSEFIANMSHDIRTPITGMLGLAESLKKNAVDASVKEDASLLMGATKELLDLLNGIIDIVDLGDNVSSNDNKIFSIEALLAHNVSLLLPAAKHKSLSLEYHLDNKIPQLLKGDETGIDRIILNLLSNSIKFTHNGHVSLSATLQKQTEHKIDLLIQVKDTGIGIAADMCDIIFERFSRLNPSCNGLYKGNGIGLYAVKKHVDSMNGRIDIESEEGQGTIFSVSLPFIIPEVVGNEYGDSKRHLNNTELESTRAENLKTTTILIVEDNALAQRMVVNLFKGLGCMIDVTATGEESVALSIDKYYDLILMDIGLPGIDGFQAAKKIREQSVLNKVTPIVSLTGHLSDNQRQFCIDAGMQDMYSKPLSQALARKLLLNYCL